MTPPEFKDGQILFTRCAASQTHYCISSSVRLIMRKKKRKLYALHVLSNNENTVLSDQPVAADDTVFPDQPVTADTPSSIDPSPRPGHDDI